jgi:hypothetical protein
VRAALLLFLNRHYAGLQYGAVLSALQRHPNLQHLPPSGRTREQDLLRHPYSPLRASVRRVVQPLQTDRYRRPGRALQCREEEGRELLLYTDMELSHEAHRVRRVVGDSNRPRRMLFTRGRRRGITGLMRWRMGS